MSRSNYSEAFNSLRKAAIQVTEAVDTCILKAGFSGEEYQFSNGISVYFPWTYLTFCLTNYRYQYLRVNRGDDDFRTGLCADWHKFLENYLSRVTFRLAREGVKTAVPDKDGKNIEIPMWSKDNPRWTRDNPRWTKDNPPLSKDNPRLTKDNPRLTKDNPPLSKGEVGEYLFYFERLKNFQLGWHISGYAEDFREKKAKPAGAV